MTVIKDFIGSIHNRWLEQNLRQSFGKLALDSSDTYIARIR